MSRRVGWSKATPSVEFIMMSGLVSRGASRIPYSYLYPLTWGGRDEGIIEAIDAELRKEALSHYLDAWSYVDTPDMLGFVKRPSLWLRVLRAVARFCGVKEKS